MALFHLHVTQVKRSAGQSIVTSAAYRAGEKLYSEYYGEVSDYTHKGGVVCTDILLPPQAPAEYQDRATLWNAVENAERGKKAQLAYSFDIALPLIITLQVSGHLEPSGGQLTQPSLIRLHRLGSEAGGLPVEEQHLKIFLEEGFIVEAAVPALAPVGAGKRDMLSVRRPAHLVTFQLHVFDEALPAGGVLQRFVDGLDQIQLPAVTAQASLVLAGLHALLFLPGIALLQHPQTVGQTDLIVHFSVCQQIVIALVELVAVLVTDAVYHHVVVQVACVNVGGDYHLEVRELLLRKLQADGIDFLGRDVVLRREGLDEVVELRPSCFAEALLGHLHLDEGRLWDAVASGDQQRIAPAGFLALNGDLSLHQRKFLSMAFDHLEQLEAHRKAVEDEISKEILKHSEALSLLCSIPGIDVTAAAAIIAEIGTDMDAFQDSQHICSWAGLSPGNNESAGKRKSAHINKGNSYLKSMLCEVGWVISGKRKLYLSGWYWRIKQRKGAKRATIALARKLLALIYTMLKTGQPYNEDCFEQRRKRCERKRANRMVNELQKLGYHVIAPNA